MYLSIHFMICDYQMYYVFPAKKYATPEQTIQEPRIISHHFLK